MLESRASTPTPPETGGTPPSPGERCAGGTAASVLWCGAGPTTPRREAAGASVPEERAAAARGDLDLARRALLRDACAIEELVDRLACVPRFLRALNRRLGSPLDATGLADLAQDVLGEVWRRLDRYQGIARLETWVFRFADLGLRGAVRRQHRERRRAGLTLDLDGVPDASSALHAQDEAEEQEQLIEGLLGQLSEQDRELLRTRFLEETSIQELGSRMGLRENAVRNRIHRAIRRLREIWKEMRR